MFKRVVIMSHLNKIIYVPGVLAFFFFFSPHKGLLLDDDVTEGFVFAVPTTFSLVQSKGGKYPV